MLKGHGGNLHEAARLLGIEQEGITDFSASINRFVSADLFAKWMKDALESLGNYPDPEYTDLRMAIAAKMRTAPESVVVGNGSTELIYLIPRMLGFKRGIVVSPSYADYADSLETAGCSIARYFTREGGFGLDSGKFSSALSAGYDVAVIGNPNNPTGTAVGREELLTLIARHPKTVFIIDESFADYCPEVSLLPEPPQNAVVLRSLTKYYGIPGLRAGYLVATPSLLSRIGTGREPWTMNCVAEHFSRRIMEGGMDYLDIHGKTAVERRFLMNGLSVIRGLKPYPSRANFILVGIEKAGLDSPMLWERMLRQRFLIRDCSNFVGMDGSFFRVAVRARNENRVFLESLENSLR